jgi:RES domain-containing protein
MPQPGDPTPCRQYRRGVVAYRLCGNRYPASSGEGDRQFGGRRSLAGTSAVYAAESRTLCILERLVHLVRLPRDEGFSRILIPADIASVRMKRSELPSGWNHPVETDLTQVLGAELMKRTAVLEVPSIVVPDEWCVVLNPNHPDFTRIRFEKPQECQYDDRLRPRAIEITTS